MVLGPEGLDIRYLDPLDKRPRTGAPESPKPRLRTVSGYKESGGRYSWASNIPQERVIQDSWASHAKALSLPKNGRVRSGPAFGINLRPREQNGTTASYGSQQSLKMEALLNIAWLSPH